MSADLPVPGDFVVVRTTAKQWFYRLGAWAIQFGTESRWNHAALYVGHVDGKDKPQIVEAEPGGAQYSDWDRYSDCEWSTGRLPAELTPTGAQRASIVAAAHSFIGTPYGFLDLVAIALAQERLGRIVRYDNPPWWVRRISSWRTMICSQLVDDAYQAGDDHLFAGRLAGLVSPGDLGRLLQPIGGQ